MTTPRKFRSPGQRAQEALDGCQRAYDRALEQYTDAGEAYAIAERVLDVAAKRLEHAKAHPDLPANAAAKAGAE